MAIETHHGQTTKNELPMSSTGHPFVSCIMPTADRRRFVPQAIRCFQEQNYANKELLILDDGDDSVADLVPSDSQIRYVRRNQKQALGAKRNECIKVSQGDLIMHWDDDDWSARHRIGYQVEALLAKEAELCGLRQMLFHNLNSGDTWLYDYPATRRRWLAGGSLLYTRKYWQRTPFRALQIGEDNYFVSQQSSFPFVALPDYQFYVAMIHSANTSAKNCRGPYWCRWLGDLRLVMGDELARYHCAEKETKSGANGMKLNLGCCDAPIPGFVNVDLIAGTGIDQVADLRHPWPWPDSSIDYIRAWDVVEHLPDKIFTMNEMYRVLVPGGSAEISVPTTDGPGAFQDPTHVSFWNRRSFLYYEAANPYRERFAAHYGIRARFKTVSERTDRSVDGPRLTIVLQAVKP
jgi:glycosyltransferase involved in cell wall biosynthesis